jgi:hypothetical protein
LTVNAITTTRASAGSLAPQSFGEAVEFSKMLARSGMVPKDYNGKPEAIMVAIQWGSEVGLGPLQALNGISVINGKPALWGDAALALVRGHPACSGIREGTEGEGDTMVGFCEVSRRGEPPQRRTFSVAEAKKAGLWGKPGPWQQYPARMLQMRARGFAIRDVFPDALRGVITAEEAQDMHEPSPTTAEPREVPNLHVEATLRAATEDVRKPMPILAPASGALHQVPINRWLDAVRKALAGLESAAAVRTWRAAMGPHLGEIHQAQAALVAKAEALIDEREADLTTTLDEPELAETEA